MFLLQSDFRGINAAASLEDVVFLLNQLATFNAFRSNNAAASLKGVVGVDGDDVVIRLPQQQCCGLIKAVVP